MHNMARINDGIVVDILRPIPGFSIEECFHADLLSSAIPVADDVQVGWIVTPDGIVPPEPTPEPMPEVPIDAIPATDPAA